MRSHTEYLTYQTAKHRELVHMTPTLEEILMRANIAEGRASELEQQTGAVVRFATQRGTPAPLHSWLRSALLPQELQARQKQTTAARLGST